jgi:hypothetical protein
VGAVKVLNSFLIVIRSLLVIAERGRERERERKREREKEREKERERRNS